jgi:membrane protein
MRTTIKTWFRVLRTSAKEFHLDHAAKLSASLAYYTVFSIGPLVLVMISLTGLFFEHQVLTANILRQMKLLLGNQGAESVVSIIEQISAEQKGSTFSLIGSAILLIGASSVFVEIQTSINYIWAIRAKPRKGWLKLIKDRLLSFSIIVGLGFLLLVSLFVNMLTDALTEQLLAYLGETNAYLLKGINLILLFLVISFLYTVIYKVLPDAFISWRDAFTGACFAAILFILGKFIIGFYLGSSDIASSYGAAAAVIIMLVWVYYSSLVLYFGAEFTKVYSLNMGRGIRPFKNAVFIVKTEARELPSNQVKHPEADEAKID